jgi:magnesium transporter
MSENKDITPENQNTSLSAVNDNDAAAVGLSDADIQDIMESLQREDGYAVQVAIEELSPADAAELLSKISDEDRQKLLEEHASAIEPETFAELPSELHKKTLEAMPPLEVAAIISELDSDDALNLIGNLEQDFQKEVIRKLSWKTRHNLEEGLTFPENSAGRLMQREFVSIPQFWTVGKTIDYLRAAAQDLPDEFFDLFVISPTHQVMGQIPLNRLVRSKRSEKMESLVLDEIHAIPAAMDQSEAAELFQRDNLTSAPVVDEEGRLIGVITIDDVIDVVQTEAQEEVLKLGGVGEDDLYRSIIPTSYFRSQWLFINLLTAFLASWVVSLFSNTIEQVVALAALMPIVAGMGGNAGTQTLAVIVRAIAIRELSGTNAPRAVYKEAVVGFLNGVSFAIITGTAILFWFHSPMLGLVIGMAMIINLIAAGVFGAVIPIILDRMGFDPAISSAVFLTTVTDIVGFFSFLGLATVLLVH